MKSRSAMICALVLGVLPLAAEAVITVLTPPPSRVRLRVGAVAGVTTVTFTVTGANAGTGVPITAPTLVLVRADAQETGCAAKTATLTVSAPLYLTSGGNNIPFNTISWTPSDGDMFAGSYSGGGSVLVANVPNCRRVENNHTFSFSNVQVYPSGTYNGVATYTLAMP